MGEERLAGRKGVKGTERRLANFIRNSLFCVLMYGTLQEPTNHQTPRGTTSQPASYKHTSNYGISLVACEPVAEAPVV